MCLTAHHQTPRAQLLVQRCYSQVGRNIRNIQQKLEPWGFFQCTLIKIHTFSKPNNNQSNPDSSQDGQSDRAQRGQCEYMKLAHRGRSFCVFSHNFPRQVKTEIRAQVPAAPIRVGAWQAGAVDCTKSLSLKTQSLREPIKRRSHPCRDR